MKRKTNSKLKSKIKNTVAYAIKFPAKNKKEITIGKVRKKQIVSKQIPLTGFKRYINVSSIRHILKEHGDAIKEAKKGQVCVKLKDFELIPQIVFKADNVVFNQTNNSIVYSKKIINKYYVVEVLRKGKSKKVDLKTMYIKKAK